MGELLASLGGDFVVHSGHAVERHCWGAGLAVHNSHSVARWLPADTEDGLVQVQLVHWYLGLHDSEKHEYVGLLLALYLRHVDA